MSEEPRPITEPERAEARRYSLVIAWSDEDDAYVVSVPEIPGLHTHGSTVAEAAEMGEEAIAVWLDASRHWGEPMPPPPQTARRVVVERPPQYDAAKIRAIRERANVSQSVFAAALNVSPSTVQSWEQGARRPDGPSLRLLELADRQPATIFRTLRPAKSG
jgi:DNA-binding transcriptional regulator YiaG